MTLPMSGTTLRKTGYIDSTRVVLYSPRGSELAVLQVDNNMEASMNRARTEELDEIAVALARYLSFRCRPDPNPSGPSEPPQKRITHDPAMAHGTPALVPDLEYSVKDAMAITKFAEVTVRKMTQDGRLPVQRKGKRVYILGRDISRVMAKRLADGSPVEDSAPEA